MKIFILCDLEGAAGVVDFKQQVFADSPRIDQARRLCTLELNALIDGCIEGGAREIVVMDGHGHGGLDIELLHREARVIIGWPRRSYWVLDNSFDAMLLYGQHAMNNVPKAVLCHSWNSRAIANCWLNGEVIDKAKVWPWRRYCAHQADWVSLSQEDHMH